ncbi:MAG: hypothetical protein HWQ36_26300 [Nostoc sp. NMS2]|uniref:hypothetical protein n=1 Tax=Nostoc sp. NMS2 TaxID=2815389 RepID=UPI0025D74279|nr:hypothetical protein [Nostoc sp. NMS2]MBN3993900.1 hypothetical protein [Nostoc sp. NMS2]
MSIFGFDGDIRGFQSILRRIEETTEQNGNLTHKQIRAYARCLLKVLPMLDLPEKLIIEITILLATLSVSGLPLYDRSFLASRILKLVDDWVFSTPKNENAGGHF